MNPLEVLMMGRAKSGSGDGGFKVTFTSVDDGGTTVYSADKTYDEVFQALTEGKFVYGVDANHTYVLMHNQDAITRGGNTVELQFISFDFNALPAGDIYMVCMVIDGLGYVSQRAYQITSNINY